MVSTYSVLNGHYIKSTKPIKNKNAFFTNKPFRKLLICYIKGSSCATLQYHSCGQEPASNSINLTEHQLKFYMILILINHTFMH